MSMKEFEGRIANHVKEDSIDVQHEITEARAVEVPLVKSISTSSIESVVNKDVRCCEIPWDISEKNAQPIFKKMSN